MLVSSVLPSYLLSVREFPALLFLPTGSKRLGSELFLVACIFIRTSCCSVYPLLAGDHALLFSLFLASVEVVPDKSGLNEGGK